MVPVMASPASATVDLTLLPPGSLEGHVTSGGQPMGSVGVAATGQAGSRGSFVVRTGDDGSYHFDKLTPDTYVVSAISGGMMTQNFDSKTIAVEAGQTAELDIDIPSTGINVTVNVTPAVFTQVFLVSGAIAPHSAADIIDLAVARGAGTVHPGFAMKDQPAAFDKIPPGGYTICGIPIPGDVNDMAAMQQLRNNADKLPVYCTQATVAPDPASQTFGLTVQQPTSMP
jgi:hypothetical protein